MSMDFAIIPADFSTTEEALAICDTFDDDEDDLGPLPAGVIELIKELDRIDAMAEDGFLSVWPDEGTSRGIILNTRWPEWVRTTYTLLDFTKDHRLALVDLQERQVFDPRDHVNVDVTLANGTKLPYLTEQIVIDVMARQATYGDYLIAARGENTYVQTLYQVGRLCAVEYRAGGPEQHFHMLTKDRALIPRLISAWLHDGAQAQLLRAQQWEPMKF